MAFNTRSILLTLAQNQFLHRLLVSNGMSKGFVKRFVAGETLAEAVAAAQTLQARHIRTTLDLLGENVGTLSEANAETEAYIDILGALGAANLRDQAISVKLTALGLDLGDKVADDNLRRILGAAEGHGNIFVRVDMEGSAYTQRTLDIVAKAHRDFARVGTVLQSSLRRTDDDLQEMMAAKIPIRLVKGAYAEPPAVAYPRKSDVDAAYVRQMCELLLHGYRPAIATHDSAIIREAKRFVRENRIDNEAFEFQMLLGVRRDLQDGLAEEGYNMRVYVPFGRAWYPYFMRRLAERPANIGFILRNLLKP